MLHDDRIQGMKWITFEDYLVGLRGFEPPTSPTPRERATGLRHSPNATYVNGKAHKDQTYPVL